MKTRQHTTPAQRTLCLLWRLRAFTLLEVMVACAIFFMVAFAVLELVTRSVVAAKALQQRDPDPGIILAALSLSNAFEEVTLDGNYEDIAPGMYPGHRWMADIREIGSNGLFEIQVATYNERKRSANPVTITGQFFRPQSKPGSASKGSP
jgi:Tfp pilus assembly protein PilV